MDGTSFNKVFVQSNISFSSLCELKAVILAGVLILRPSSYDSTQSPTFHGAKIWPFGAKKIHNCQHFKLHYMGSR